MDIMKLLFMAGFAIFVYIGLRFLVDSFLCLDAKYIPFAFISFLVAMVFIIAIVARGEFERYEEVNAVQANFITAQGEIEGIPIHYGDLGGYVEYFDSPEVTSFDAPIEIHLYTDEELKRIFKKRDNDKLIIGKIYHVR